MKKLFWRDKDGELHYPKINIVCIIIPTVIFALGALYFLWQSGFFMTENEKLAGRFSRVRTGSYSGEKYTESYEFTSDGKGTKICVYPDGYEAEEKFSWTVTKKKTLVIDGHVKYVWNTKSNVFFDETATTSKKMWYIDKDGLYFGDCTSPAYDEYDRKTELAK